VSTRDTPGARVVEKLFNRAAMESHLLASDVNQEIDKERAKAFRIAAEKINPATSVKARREVYEELMELAYLLDGERPELEPKDKGRWG
jgi:hypothetical protein